jgi:hypothetical protein
MRMCHRLVGLLVTALLLASCGPAYTLDCGPLGRAACGQRAADIESMLRENFPDRTISSLVIVNAQGDSEVVLDDGTGVGIGGLREDGAASS